MIKFKDFIVEAKEVVDIRHQPSTKEFWPAKQSPEYIAPSDGFHFIYYNGNLILSSTSNDVYSAAVKFGEGPSTRLGGVNINYPNPNIKKIMGSAFNQFGGKVDLKAKTITISKASAGNKMVQRHAYEIKNDSKAFKELFRYGVTNDFKIKGMATTAKTVGEFISQEDPVDQYTSNKPMTFYHGTTVERAQLILKQGLRPGLIPYGSYIDQIKGYTENNVYLATTPKSAIFYGKRQAEKDGTSGYVVLQITNIDQSKLVSDDSLARKWEAGKVAGVDHTRVKASLGSGAEGQVGYNGIILPSKIKIFKVYK